MPRFVHSGVALLLLTGGCATAPPADNPSAPRPPRSDAEQKIEARQLEQAQAKCTQEGKTAVASRVENSTVYNCVAAGDAAAETPKH
ncbi:MAG TPA: hypothetical protein VID49_02100 [Steroidobacteraceae bacterium]|jgi:hypothetical protein